MQVVAKCQKCGREFVTEPAEYPARDPFWRRDKYDQRPKVLEECNGEIVPVVHETR